MSENTTPRIVSFTLAQPIRSKDIHWGNLMPNGLAPTTLLGDAVKVEQENPITVEMRRQIPLLSDDGLRDVRKMLEARIGDKSQRRGNIVTSVDDVRAWLAMVDDETRRRVVARKGELIVIVKAINATISTDR